VRRLPRRTRPSFWAREAAYGFPLRSASPAVSSAAVRGTCYQCASLNGHGVMRTILLASVITCAGVFAAIILGAALFIALNWAPERSVDDLRARWAPPPSTFIDVAGMRVHLRDEGPRDDDSPIVL